MNKSVLALYNCASMIIKINGVFLVVLAFLLHTVLYVYLHVHVDLHLHFQLSAFSRRRRDWVNVRR